MSIRHFCYFSASWCTFKKAFLDKKGFIDLFNCAGFFTDAYGYSVYANRSASEFLNDSKEDPFIHFIKTVFIDFKRAKRDKRDIMCYFSAAFDLCKVAGTRK